MNDSYKSYYRTVKKNNKKTINCFLIVFVVIILTIFFCFIIFPLFGLISWSTYNEKEANSKMLYLVAINSGDDQEEAEELAKNYRARGGAGVVWNKDEYYWIILGIYFSYDDSNSVVINLYDENIEAEVIEFKIKKPDTKTLKEEDEDLFDRIFKFLLEILDELYSLIVKLEQSSITDISANLSLNNMALSAEYYYNLLIEKNNLKTLNNIVANVVSLLRYVANEEVLMDSFLPYESEIRRILVRIVIIINELL